MIVGHYAAALIPHSRLKTSGVPFWLLLLCANVPEFLWLLLAVVGVEPPTPDSMLDATFANLRVAMTYSHNLVPALIQAVVVGGLVRVGLQRRDVASWCAFLVFFHVLCDYVVGFEHQLLGPGSPEVALNSYGRAPHLAMLFELAFSLGCIFWYHRSEAKAGRAITPKRRLALYAVFVIGIGMWLPAATTPLRVMLPW